MTDQDKKIADLELEIAFFKNEIQKTNLVNIDLTKQLAIQGVSNRRELLDAFVDKYNDRVLSDKRICNDEVDIYLDSI